MRTLVALLVAVLGTAAAARAQITPCPAVNDTSSRAKILLDDIVSESDLQNLLQSLTSRLDANLEQIQTELGVDLKVLPCAARRPTGPSDFNRSTVDQLNVRGVLMEVWGTTTAVKDSQGRPLNEASIGYVIIPVRLDELQSQPAPGAFVIPHRAPPSTVVEICCAWSIRPDASEPMRRWPWARSRCGRRSGTRRASSCARPT